MSKFMYWQGRAFKPMYCKDCGKLHHPKDMYVLKNNLWKMVSNGAEVLCRRCFERRLGRKLKNEDYKKIPINYRYFIERNKNQYSNRFNFDSILRL